MATNEMPETEAAYNCAQGSTGRGSPHRAEAALAMSQSQAATSEAGARGATQRPPRPHSERSPPGDAAYEPSPGICGLLDLLKQARKPSYARTYRRALAEHAPAPRSQPRPRGDVAAPSQPPPRPLQLAPVELVALRTSHIYAPETRRDRAPDARADASGPASPQPQPPPRAATPQPRNGANSLELDVGAQPGPLLSPPQPQAAHTPLRIQLSKHLVLNGPRLPHDPLFHSPGKSVLGIKRPRQASSSASSSEGASSSESDSDDDSESEPAETGKKGIGRRKRKRTQPATLPDEEPTASGDFLCGLNGCVKRYPSLADVVRHRRTSALHAEKQFKCECGLAYTRPDGLKRHKDTTGHYFSKSQKSGKSSRGGRGRKSRGRGGSTKGRASGGGHTTPVDAPIPSDQTSVSPVTTHFVNKFSAPPEMQCRNCSQPFTDGDLLDAHEYKCIFSGTVDPAHL